MVSDTEVATRGEEQGRRREEQCTQTKRSKSKGPSMDALEARMVGLEEAISGMQTTLSDAVDRLDGLETDYGEITQATKSTICESQKGFKEDVCFLAQEFCNLCTFVEHELRAIHVKEFTALILEIEDMSNKDKLFYFMDSLKDWAKVELERRNVQDLDTVIVAAKLLGDNTQPKEQKYIHEKSKGDESKDHNCKDKGRSKSPNGNNRRDKPNGGKPEAIKPKSPCFICNGPH
ncbi:hypothetical protein EZV62_008224 [Acer yangbiense]|uniref:Uncharacterized protein n=1 Tax=Acer yangbiense TaxID=1000413 RepID=A0A5C7IDG5_9ROSI|nr:hypothetical protein EZV62_008224 [Acer yangbiense]